jgi:hypothetical protein
MKIYKIECEWEMPIANGYFVKKEDAKKAIEDEDWEGMTDRSLSEVKKGKHVYIETITLK